MNGQRELRLAAVAALAFLLTAAAMVRWYAAPQAGRLPLDPDITVTSTGSGQVWDVGRGRAVTGDVREEVRIRGDRAAGSAAVAVWQVERRLTRPDGTLLRLATERVALDRRTAEAVACCGEQPRHTGLEYAFPPGLDRSTRELFDPATGTAAAVRYVGREPVGGLTAYRMEQVAGPVQRAGRAPGAPPAGRPAGAWTVTVSARRTVWVEPASGLIVRLAERRAERAAVAGGAPVTLLDVTLASDPDSTRRLAALATARRERLALLRTTVPLGCLLAALVVAAAVLVIPRVPGRPASGRRRGRLSRRPAGRPPDRPSDRPDHNAVTAPARSGGEVSRSSDTRW